MVTREQLQEYADFLERDDYYDQEAGYSKFGSDPFGDMASVTCCAFSAQMFTLRFGGSVYGYFLDVDDPELECIHGYWSQGHDFAIIGKYLVDWWAKHVEGCGRVILDMTDPNDILYIQKHYLPLDKWEKMAPWPVKKVA
jgi:hypothetical protein